MLLPVASAVSNHLCVITAFELSVKCNVDHIFVFCRFAGACQL
jgi:hypothetical protein